MSNILQAVRNNDTTEVQRLLRGKSYRLDDMRTALEHALRRDNLGCVKLILDHINKADKNRALDMALLQAAKQGQTDCLGLVLNSGAQPMVNDFAAPLAAAAGNAHINCVKLLLQHGAAVDVRKTAPSSRPVWSALHEASAAGNVECVTELLNHGADVNRQTKGMDSTALHLAARNGHVSCIDALCKHGANVHIEDCDGQHALFWASEGGHANCVKALLQHGSDANHLDACGFSALWTASLKGHIDCVTLLLNNGALVTTEGYCKRFALDVAAAKGRTAIVDLLKQHLAAAAKETDKTPKSTVKSRTSTIHELMCLEMKQRATTSEELQALTVRLNDTANTTEVLRRDVAALKLSNSDANEFWQSLSELETKQKVLQPKVDVLQRSDVIHKGEHC